MILRYSLLCDDMGEMTRLLSVEKRAKYIATVVRLADSQLRLGLSADKSYRPLDYPYAILELLVSCQVVILILCTTRMDQVSSLIFGKHQEHRLKNLFQTPRHVHKVPK